MSRYNGNVTSENIEDCLYYGTQALVGIDPVKIDRFTKNFFEVLPSHDGSYAITLYKDRQILVKPSHGGIDLATLFTKPDGKVADDSNAKAYGKKIANELSRGFEMEFDVKPSRITPGYCIQFTASIKKGEDTKKEGKFDLKDEEPKTKELTKDSRETITKGTGKMKENKLIESFFDAQADDFIPADYEEREELEDTFNSDIWSDDYDGEDADITKSDLAESPDDEEFDDYDYDDDVDIEDESYWDDAKEIDPSEFEDTWCHAYSDDEIVALDDDDMEAHRAAFSRKLDIDIGEDKNPARLTDDWDEQDEMFESVLKECDGGMTAGAIASEVPENMGAVVQSDKKDKKYSSVFDEE